jgi:hypothetical protein
MLRNLFEKLCLSWQGVRNSSPNNKASASSINGNSVAIVGSKNNAQVAEKIYNYNPSQTALEDHDSWNALLNCFGNRTTEIIIMNYTKDQKRGKDLEIAYGWIKFVNGKFNNVQVLQGDSRVKDFVNIRSEAVKTLDYFMNSKDTESFKMSWSSYGEALSSLRDQQS